MNSKKLVASLASLFGAVTILTVNDALSVASASPPITTQSSVTNSSDWTAHQHRHDEEMRRLELQQRDQQIISEIDQLNLRVRQLRDALRSDQQTPMTRPDWHGYDFGDTEVYIVPL